MEYCALGSIRDLIETGNSPLNEEEIAFVTYHTLAGLTVLHAKNIIHRYLFILLFYFIYLKFIYSICYLLLFIIYIFYYLFIYLYLSFLFLFVIF